MNTVVVTGAAGSIGCRVVETLLGRDDVHKVVGIDLLRCEASHPKLVAVVADLSEPGAVDYAQLVAGIEGNASVVNLAWAAGDTMGLDSQDRPLVAAANSRSTKSVLEVAAQCGAGSVVHVSSATVYGAWADNDVPLSEESRILPNPELPFAVAKAEAERVIAEWSDIHRSVPVAVMRPAVTVGSGDKPLYQALEATRTPLVAQPDRLVQYLHVDDLVSAVVFAWENRLDGVFNVAPDSGISEDEARQLAGGIAKVGMPGRLAYALSTLGWKLGRRGVPPEAFAYATHPWVVSPDRLVSLGWRPAYSSAEALVETDGKWHWDDLPPGKRQNFNTVVALCAAGSVLALVTAFLLSRRRRTNRSALHA